MPRQQGLQVKEGRGGGKHTLVLETLGEKSPESSNSWITISGFAVPFELPDLNAADVAQGALAEDAADMIAAWDVQDRRGQTVRLRDFGTAGYEAPYFSWIKVEGAAGGSFSKTNPSRAVAAR